MNEDKLSQAVKKIEDMYKRFLHVNFEYKYLHLKHLWEFINHSEYFSPIVAIMQIKGKTKSLDKELFSGLIVDENKAIPLPEREEDRMILSCKIIERVLSPNHDINILYQIGRNYSTDKQRGEQYYFNLFNALFLEPLIQNLIYEIGEKNAILAVLKKYKYKSEWFKRQYLWDLSKYDTKKTEHNLTLDFYEYLFDSGVDIFIEPWSPSGEVDLIALQKKSKEKIIAEGKIFDGNRRGKSHIRKAIGQIISYLKENNEWLGFLVIYQICEKNIVFNFKNEASIFPYLNRENKTVIFIVINVYNYPETASKRGVSKTVEINEDDIN